MRRPRRGVAARRAGKPMARLSLEDALDRYGIPRWGRGFFGISPDGRLTVRPARTGEAALADVVSSLRERGVEPPVVLRFPQILRASLDELTGAFRSAMEEFHYRDSGYVPVYPLKVNQRRPVVRALLEAGREYGMGLEAGSRSELLLALGLGLPEGSMICVNGYKDADTLRLALLGARLGLRVIVVIEKLFEVDLVEALFRGAGGPLPELGVRTRLFARGSGKWWKSSGTTAKFGLSTASLLEACARLDRAGLLDRLSTVHFHIGSQIPEIRRLKGAFREGARLYAKLRRQGVPVSVLNVGGGLAVDYDGSRTASDASRNYSVQEYANDVVYTVREICAEERVPLPTLVSESGRALTAYHSLLVTNVLGRIAADPPLPAEPPPDGAPRVVRELFELCRDMGAKTYREFFHDAVELRDEMITMFNVGMLSLEERALAEQLFWQVAREALRYARRERVFAEEFEQLERALHDKFIANFSVFQSAPDHWALEQLFPVVPLTRLTEEPTLRATVVDITCDSDGEIDHFVDVKDVKEVLELHDPADRPGEPYDLAILLLGAYQDVMGDLHNLFGAPADADVVVDSDGNFEITRIDPPDSAERVLGAFGFQRDELVRQVAARIDRARREGRLGPEEAAAGLRRYTDLFDGGTYLKRGA
ncbi:MAG: biosynthetic arginine decarboxylase [Acidobacteria bacterium]|nr:MAG: biosynthetic arginine decarboxylase [Acidobacteriota bacterium]